MNQVLEEQQPIPAGNSSEVATAVKLPHSLARTVMSIVGYMSSEPAKVKPNEIDQRIDIRAEAGISSRYDRLTKRLS